jgi:hypothetical protein
MNPRIQFWMEFVAALLIITWFLGSVKQIRKDTRERNNR